MTAAKYKWLSFICFGVKHFFFGCVFLVLHATENNGQIENIFDLGLHHPSFKKSKDIEE